MPDTLTRPPSWSAHKSRHTKPLPRYLLAFEWGTEWLVYWLKRWAFVELLSIVGSFALLATLVSYCRGADDRARTQQDTRRARQFQAWQVITNAQGKPGNGGRTLALQNLAGDSVDLSGVDISGAWLEGLAMPGATLRFLKATSSNLSYADLRGADLTGADLSHVTLQGADLRGADLQFARLNGSRFYEACLDGANLFKANLDSAQLFGASMRGASAKFASLEGASLPDAATLDSVEFYGSSLDTTWALSRHRSQAQLDRDLSFSDTGRLSSLDSTGFSDSASRLETKTDPDGQDLIRPWRRAVGNLDSIYPRRKVDGPVVACNPSQR
jgi:uncharacterized protein YjbI with pentapeptide repeats